MGGSFAAATGLASLVAADVVFDKLSIPLVVKTMLVVVLALAAIVFIVSVIWLGLRLLGVYRANRASVSEEIDEHTCNLNDIDAIAAIAETQFGSAATDTDATRRLHSIDPQTFSVFKNQAGTIVGYACIIRLNKAGIEAIQRNDFHLDNIPPEYVNLGTKVRYSNVYIGAIYGKNRHVAGHVMAHVSGRLKEIRARHIYARAATSDGVRVLTKRGFLSLAGMPPNVGDVCYRKGIP
jgi:hypothetical protein